MKYSSVRIFADIFFIGFFVTSCFFKVYGQENNFRFDKITSENIKIEKGLSVNSVFCMLQDSKGFMWFGTWDGLNKFDGYKFTVYKSSFFEKENEISNQFVHALCEDKEGNIWIGTQDGLNKFNSYNQSFIHYKHNFTDKTSISSDTIWAILEDSKGNLWLGTQYGLNLMNKKTKTFTKFFANHSNLNSLSNNSIFDICEDNSGNIWLATEYGLNKFNPETKTFTKYFKQPYNKNSLSCDTIRSVYFSKEGYLWIATDNGLNKLNPETNAFVRYINNPEDLKSLSDNHVSYVFEDSKGTLWVGTNGGGLNIFNRKNNTFARYQYVINDENSLSNNFISSILEDKSGIIWLATSKGVNKINKSSYKFIHYQHIENNVNSLNNNVVWTFYEDKKNNVWLGTDDGINIFNRKTYKFFAFKHGDSVKNNTTGNVIKAIICDNDGYIWAGTENAGLDKLVVSYKGNHPEIKIINNFNIKNGLCDNTVWCILQDNDDYIWIGTNNGLNRFDKKKNKLKSFKYNPYNPYSISNNVINTIYQDKDGTVWFGTYNGLNKYDKKSGKFYSYKHVSGNSQTLSSNCIFGIYEDNEGNMWLGTLGGGLNKFNKTTGTFKYYTENEGLANNMVYSILLDNNNLWLTTNNGLSKFNIKTETFVNYDIKDGLQSSEFNQNAAIKTSDEMFFIGGMNGFNAFFPQDIKQNPFVSPIVITNFKIFNIVQKTEINNNDTIFLNYYDNFFSFEFSSLDFSNPQKNNYAFKLENFDKTWTYCDANRRFAEYTKISPGIYKFRVKGSNCDGIWNEKGISVTIIITPPWWATWTFRILSTLIVIAAIWFLLYRRFRQLRKKHEIEKKMLEIEKQLFDLEQKSLRLQMNPHFIFNSLNSIQSFIINNDSDKAILYLAKFAQLMRMILSNSTEPFVSIKDEIKTLKYYVDIENLRFDNKFNFKINLENNIDADFVGIPPMIIQPYVENAILHGIIHKQGKGNVTVNLSLQNEHIFCVVEDDGVGREKSMEIKKMSGLKHKSKGMVITKERLEILNKQIKGHISVIVIDLKDNEDKAIGTKVEIIIPFKEI